MPVYKFYQKHSSCCGIKIETAIVDPVLSIDSWGDVLLESYPDPINGPKLVPEALRATEDDFEEEVWGQFGHMFRPRQGIMILRWVPNGVKQPADYVEVARDEKGALFAQI